MRMATCMFHRFDAETHRCTRCGRWQAGFAPKKARVKPVAECQVCERVMATDKDGTLGHHGYQRPGWGSLVGDCFGEGYQPFPAVDALQRWLAHVELRIEALADLKQRTQDAVQLTHSWQEWNTKEEKKVTVKAGDRAQYIAGGHTVPSFDNLKEQQLRNIEQDTQQATRERTRVQARIEKGLAAQ